jgi:predicted nucleic acid-binding protein
MIQLFEETEDRLKLISGLAILEVRSAIRRRQHAGDTPRADAELAIRSLDMESKRIVQHTITSVVMEVAARLIDNQFLRALDAIQLATAVTAREMTTESDEVRFVASDHKLLAAASAEGFIVWNPVTP